MIIKRLISILHLIPSCSSPINNDIYMNTLGEKCRFLVESLYQSLLWLSDTFPTVIESVFCIYDLPWQPDEQAIWSWHRWVSLTYDDASSDHQDSRGWSSRCKSTPLSDRWINLFLVQSGKSSFINFATETRESLTELYIPTIPVR